MCVWCGNTTVWMGSNDAAAAAAAGLSEGGLRLAWLLTVNHRDLVEQAQQGAVDKSRPRRLSFASCLTLVQVRPFRALLSAHFANFKDFTFILLVRQGTHFGRFSRPLPCRSQAEHAWRGLWRFLALGEGAVCATLLLPWRRRADYRTGAWLCGLQHCWCLRCSHQVSVVIVCVCGTSVHGVLC